MSIVIIDTGGANLASLGFALERLGRSATVSSSAETIRAAGHVLLPGVGAAGDAMQRLRRTGLDRLIPALTQPVLGICLGMQLLLSGSRENDSACLGVIPGVAERFIATPDRPVPHMGWNRLQHNGSGLFRDIEPGAHVYFVHAYRLPPVTHTVATSDYGGAFSAAIAWRNFFGTQFHPERSGAAGARVLRNFIELRRPAECESGSALVETETCS